MALHHAAVDAVVRRRLALLVPAAILAALASLAPVAQAVPACAAAGSHHAALVVEHGDGSIVSRCVAFSTAAISGEELLNRSGVVWSSQTFGGFGAAVCALDGEPAHYVDCPGKDRYWAVFAARGGGSWQLANVGISTLTLHDGDARRELLEPVADRVVVFLGGLAFGSLFLHALLGGRDQTPQRDVAQRVGPDGMPHRFQHLFLVLDGDGVYLEGGGGIAAGYYSLLTPEYAFMPGAIILTDLSKTGQSYTFGQTLSREGYPLTMGSSTYSTVAGTNIRSGKPTEYTVRKAQDVLAEGYFVYREITAGEALDLLGQLSEEKQ